jgi:hypothetical protein
MAALETYRMLALDVDGTIATKEHRVPDAILTAIGNAVTAGTIVSIVTGRMRRSAIRFAELCRTNGPTISYQGAVTTSPDGMQDIHTERLSPGVALSSIALMRDAGAHINLYHDDRIFVEDDSKWARDYATRMETELHIVGSLDEMAREGPTIVMAVDDPDRIEHLATILRKSAGADAAVTRSLPHFCEVAPGRTTKASALERVCGLYGIGPAEVIAIGDGEGDVSMIEWAGLGVAAGKAHSSAVSAARLHIPGPEENGVAELVQKLLREGKLGRHSREPGST